MNKIIVYESELDCARGGAVYDIPMGITVEQALQEVPVLPIIFYTMIDDGTIDPESGGVLVAERAERVVGAGEVVRVIGGHLGEGATDFLRMAMIIGISAFAPQFAGGVTGATSGFFYGAVNAATAIVGALVVNSILPVEPEKKKTPTKDAVYNVGIQGNSPLEYGGAIPVLYGRFRWAPAMIGRGAFAEYINNDHYLNFLFVVTAGDAVLHNIYLGDTSAGAYEDVTHELVAPGDVPTLFNYRWRVQPDVSGLPVSGKDTVNNWFKVRGVWYGYTHADTRVYGPYRINPRKEAFEEIAVDLSAPGGLYYGGSNYDHIGDLQLTIKVHEIDHAGAIIEDVHEVECSLPRSKTSTTPIRRTVAINYAGEAGKFYGVSIINTGTEQNDIRVDTNVQWDGLRVRFGSNQAFNGMTVLLVRAKGSGNLSAAASQRVMVEASRKIDVWTDGAWVSTQTGSAVWAAVDVLRNNDYGGAQGDGRFDLPAMMTMAQTAGEFNGVFAGDQNCFEALKKVCFAVRGTPVLSSGKLDVVIDKVRATAVAHFLPRNIVKGSFSLAYNFSTPDDANGAVIEYIDSESWRRTDVVVNDDATRPVRLFVPGVTGQTEAQALAEHIYNQHLYRRLTVDFETEMMGFIPKYGDRILVSYDVPNFGQSGEIESYDESTMTMKVSVALDWSADGAHYIRLRGNDGMLGEEIVVTQAEGGVVLASLPDVPIYTTGADRLRTTFAFGPQNQQARGFLVLNAAPRSGGERVQITAVNDDERVYG